MRQPYGVEYSIERLRASAVVFAGGKAISAVLNIYVFYLAATRLPVPTYALYVWLLAFGRLLRQLSEVGISAIALHYVPYVHSQFGGAVWRRFVLTLVGARLAVIVFWIGATVALAHGIVEAFGDRSWLEPFRWYALVLAIEHALEFLRRCIFAPLMRQVAFQLNVITQAGGILVALLLGMPTQEGDPTIYWILGAHACGSGLALGLALVQFWPVVRARSEPRGRGTPPTWREMIGFGLENSSHDLLNLSAAPQIMTLLGRRLIGVAELATFGFIQNLYLRLERLVPGRFFMGLIRPNLVVRYHADQSVAELNRRIVLVLKLSFCVWAALAMLFVLGGEPIVALLSADKYRDGYGLLIGFVAILAIQDLKRVLILVANMIGRSDMLRRAGFVYLIAVPTAVALVAAGAGFYGLLLGMVVAELGVVVDVVRRMGAAGLGLDFDLDRQLRIFAAAAGATLVGAVVMWLLPESDALVLLCTALTLPVYALALWRLRPLRADERAVLERLLNRKLSWL